MIAPSFGDIHANNCAKNGLLTVVLPEAECAAIGKQLREQPGADDHGRPRGADGQRIPPGKRIRFDIHPVRKKCLLEGLDDIARTRQYDARLERFEAAYRGERPWLFDIPRT